MAGRARGNPGPGGRELSKRGSSDQVTRRGDRRDNTAAAKNPTAADKPQPRQVKEAVQENKPEETAAAQAGPQESPDKKGEPWYDEAMANAERDLAEDAEWKRIQENTFTRWVNEHLRQAGTSINDLETDFSNGLKLIALLEVLSGKKMPRYNKKTSFRSQKLENVSIALKFLETEGVHLVNIDSTHITDCKLKLIMGLIWTLILHYSISMPMYDGPELGGHIEEKTPKQRLLGWMQNKIPGCPINNFTSDWTDGIKVGALVDSVAPGLCPDWEDWDPNEPIRNATEAMDLADNWLGVPKLLTPEEIINPNVDEQSMMTYLSQFPNAKVKEGAPFREKALASKVRAHGPGLEATGNVAKAPAKFTVETFGAGDGDLAITVKGPDGTDYKVDKTYNNDRKKSYSCSYFPDKEGDFTVPILWGGRNIPKSPFNVQIEGFAGDANKVTVAGPGVEPEGVVANRPTDFDIFTEGAGRGKPEVIVLDPHGLKDAIPVKLTPTGDDVYHCEYMPSVLGVHSVNVFFAGNPIPDSPFGVRVGPASNPSKVQASGRGLQPHGIRAQELVDFKVFTEGAGDGVAAVKIIGPGGIFTPTTSRNIDPHTIEYKYTPERDGRYRVMITWAGKEIPRSPFEVNVSPLKSSKIKAYGPGLQGGVVDMPALFTVDTCGETGSLGFSIEGPSQAKINCKDNGDGSAEVDYVPTVDGEYAVHILCDAEDIPGSPFMAQILPKTDYDPGKVKCYGPGLEEVVQPNEETHFTIDAREAGLAPLDVLFMDDYGEVKPLWKDENGIHDPKQGGILAVKLIRAKELIKGDLVGKSDPYAVIRHGAQKYTTKVVKNSHEPEWNYEAQVTIPDQGDLAVTIELFDKDRLGKDKSLGVLSFDTSRIVSEKVIEQGWYSLSGVTSGQVLMSADFVSAAPSLAKDARPEHQRRMSHKNLDVRRPILEKKAEGMFECAYSPRKTQKLVICVNYGGVAVPDSPFRVTVDDPTDPNKVKVYGKGVEDGNKTGKPVEFTVDCKEAGPGDLEINITDDKGNELPINVKDNNDHTFNIQYNPKKNGPHIVDVKYDGRDVPQSPITVNVKTDIDLRKIKVLGLDDEVFVDCTNDFDVDTSGLPADVTPNIGCSIKTPDGSDLKDLKVDQPRPDTAGKAKVSYTPTKEGKHEVNVTCDGDPIHGSPFKIKAKKGCDPKRVKAYGPGLENGVCHEPNQFTIETRNAGKGDLGLSIEGPAEAKMTCKDNNDGSCNVDYIPTVPGNYDIFVKLEDKNIPGSPFKVPVTDPNQDANAALSGAAGPLAGSGLSSDDDQLPNGKLNVKVIKAKELIKADLIGKSDPYVRISYGQQKFKTPTVKNSQEPKWDYELELDVPENHLTEVKFEVFDADKIGKDKSLGSVSVPISELAALNDAQGQWYSLAGVKSGKILLSADFTESDSDHQNGDPTKALSGTKDLAGGTGLGPHDGSSSRDPSGKSKLPKFGQLPPGEAQIYLVKAKELIKTDLIGKSDPYAKIGYGTQVHTTPTIKNTQEPKWDFCAKFDVPEGDQRNVAVEVFDSDKLGRDKSLGKVEVDLAELVNNESGEGQWYPLIGVKSGKVLLFADFLEDGAASQDDPNAVPDSLKTGDGDDGALGLRRKLTGSGDPNKDDDDNKNLVGGGDDDLPSGVAKINLIKAQDLIKADIIGKSDPYAVLSHGGQKDKTKTVKNSQDPVWNHVSEFRTPDNNSRTFDIEVFDSDKIGKDKSLGKLSLDIVDVLELDGADDGKWFPLSGVKSGKVLLSADFLDDLGRRASDILPGILKNGDPRRGSQDGGRGDGGDSRKPSRSGLNDDGDAGANKKRHPSVLNGDVPHVPASALPSGKAKIMLIKAKELIQADKNSKSDPYAMMLYGKQVEKTKVVQNCHEPEWNHEAEFDFPEGDERTFRIELFDSDRVGKDSSLGHLDLDITDVLALDPQFGAGKWFPLSGVASGQVLLSADFIDDLGRSAGDILDNLLKGLDADGNPIRKSSTSDPASAMDDNSSDYLPNGTATINLIKAKNLMKIDPNEKTHPYAVMIHGKQVEKTKTIKNTTEPQWDHKAEFRTPDGNSREFHIEVFDSEKYGKDHSLGSVTLDITDILKIDNLKQGQWYPLDGATSGEILLSADFLDDLGRRPEDILKDLLKNDKNRKKSAGGLGKSGQPGAGDDDVTVVSLGIIKAKDLIKTDLIGKSDPYAVIRCGDQQDKTPVVKNSQNPEWNHNTELIIPVHDGPSNVTIEVFDHDKLGKDKSLGKLELDLDDLADMADAGADQGRWFPLKGVKSGQILLSADILDGGDLSGQGNAPLTKNRNKSLSDQGPSDGKARVHVIKAKDLINADSKGFSDPYALIKYGGQKFKTPTVMNSQEPEWDCEMEFDFPDGEDDSVRIEVLDEDALGRDESLGCLDLPLSDLAAMDPSSGYWFPLEGVESGEILISGDITEALGDNDDDNGGEGVRGRPSVSGKDGAPYNTDDGIPEGQMNVKLVKAKDLIKADMFGKSDPYAVLKFGSQKDKTPVVKNSQNPEWNHDATFETPDGPDQTLNIEVFDSDKIGKDKSLGKLDLDLQDLLDNNGQGGWYPLQGVKSGEILLESDFLPLESLGDKARGGQGADAKNKGKNDKKKSGSLGSGLTDGDIPEGVVHLDLVKAKDLDNEDKKGKSDPYAVIKYGKQKAKTNTIKNTLNPQWNFSSDFKVPDGQDKTLNIEILDNDRFGRDKSLGKLDLDIGELLNNDLSDGKWYPLDGSKAGQVFIASDFLSGDGDGVGAPDKAGQAIGGQGSGPADPSKVLAYGPGLEPGQVMPGRPATFTVDSSNTGPAPLEVEIESDGGRVSGRKPSLTETGPGCHDVTYVPPPIGHPYQIGVKYGGEDIPGSPFEMTSNADTSDVIGDGSRKSSAVGERKESKIGISVNPDNDNNLGKIHVGLIKAKDLVKTDLVGKSDPYAILAHGNQKFKTDTAKNTQNPEFNYEADFNVPDNGDNKIKIDVLDSDRFGKDKPLGSAILDVDDIMTKGTLPPTWIPLKGAKSGEVFVTANFEPLDGRFSSPDAAGALGVDGSRRPSSIDNDGRKTSQSSDGRKPSYGMDGRKSSGPGAGGAAGLKNKLLSGNPDGEEGINPEDLPEGTLHLDVLGARNLPKSDLIGKSDPYAEIALGDQVYRTPTVNNSQEPEWNYGADFDLDGNQPTDVELNIYDQDKLGKDKPLGSALLPVEDLLDRASDPGAGPVWVPLAGVKSGEVLVDTNFSPLDDSNRRMSGHGTGKSRTGRQGSSDSLLGDNGDGPNAGGGKALRDKLKDPKSKNKSRDDGSSLSEDLVPGNLHFNLIKAENLPKTDLIGKSDPYAVISIDGDIHKTDTIKNSQNPEWNFHLDVPIDEDGPHDINIDVFDKDRIGKDKHLGSANLNVADLQNGNDLDGAWMPLDGAKSGDIQVSTQFTPDGSDPATRGGFPSQLSGKKNSSGRLGEGYDPNDPSGTGSRKGSQLDPNDPTGGRRGSQPGGGALSLKKKLDGSPDDEYDPNNPNGRKGSQYGPNGSRKGSQYGSGGPGSEGYGDDEYDPNYPDGRKGSQYGPNDPNDPSYRGPGSRKGSQFDPNDPNGGRRGSQPGGGALSLKKKLDGSPLDEYDPNNPNGRKGSQFGSNDPNGSRRGSQFDPNDPNNRKGSQYGSGGPGSGYGDEEYDPNNPNARKGSQYGSNDPNGSRRGSQFDPNDPNNRKSSNISGSGSRKGSQYGSGVPGSEYGDDEYDPNNPNGRKGSQFGSNDPNGARRDSQFDPNNPNNRKGSQYGSGSGDQDGLPSGNVHLNVHGAEGLGKGDLIGKSDPYAVISYDGDQHKTPTVKNNQNPEWEYETDLPVSGNGPKNIDIDVYDKDRFGKDKLLGSTSLDVADLIDNPLNQAKIPLDGSKTGKLNVSADFVPTDGYDMSSRKSSRLEESYSRKTSTMSEMSYSRKSSEVYSRKASEMSIAGSRKASEMSIAGSRKASEMSVSGSRKASEMSISSRRQSEMSVLGSRKPSGMVLDDDEGLLGPGLINLNVHGAKDLVKKDLIGKSDPYAVLSYGDRQLKSDPVKNSQNPSWDFQAQLPVDENSPDKFRIEVFDKDKIGKDKPLGHADFDIPSIADGQNLDRHWVPLQDVKSGQIQVSAEYEPEDPSTSSSSRKPSSLAGGLGLRKGSKEEDYDPNDPRLGSGSRKGSQQDPNDPRSGSSSRKGSQFDPNDPSGVRKGSQLGGGAGSLKKKLDGSPEDSYLFGSDADPNNGPDGRKRSDGDKYGRKGSQDSDSSRPGSRRGSEFDPNSDPSGRSGSRKGSQYDPDGNSAGPGSRKGSQQPGGGGALSLKKRLEGAPEDSYLYGSDSDPRNRSDSRKNSGQDGSRPGSRKGSQYDPDNDLSRGGSRKGSQFDDSRAGSRKGSQSQYDADDDYSRVGSRKGSQSDADDYNNRKNSGGAKRLKDDLGRQKSGVFPALHEDVVPIGNVHFELNKAQNLIKADMIGKSDPYAVVSYGDESYRTNTIKNNQNPEWNFEKDFQVDPNGPRTINIDIFDDDKLGKDKPLGSADIDIPTLINNANLREAWIPLDGVKNGEIQVSADFTPYDEMDDMSSRKSSKTGGNLIPEKERDGMRNRGGSPGNDDTFGSGPNQRKPSDKQAPGLIHLNIVQAKDLIKADMIGKSDPFAVVTYGDKQYTTETVKNNLNPQWNFEADIPYNPNYSDSLRIDIYDDDKLGKNKLLGSTTVDIPVLASQEPLDEIWFPLDGVRSGQVQLSAEYVPSSDLEDPNSRKMSGGPLRDHGSLGAPRSAKSPANDKLGTIQLDLLMGKDLIKTDLVGKSDPYAIITHGDQRFKTPVQKNTQNPEWNIQCPIEVPDGNDRNISIELYDSDKFGKDKFLGNLNMDIAKIMNLGQLDEGWYPLDGVKQGQIRVGANFIPELDDTSTIIINQKFTETRRTSKQFQEVSLNRIPLPSTGGDIDASIRAPSGRVDIPSVQDDGNGTVAIKYQPSEEGMHYLDVRYNQDHVQGSPFKFHVTKPNSGKASAYGPGLTHGVCGEPANFTVSTKGAGAGGLHLAVEGPSKADITCNDNKDGTVDVSYLPTAPGEYKITAKFADEHIPGSPFSCKITGEGKKRNQISVGSSSELQLPGNLTETDLRSLKAYIESPSGVIEQCFLKKLPRGNIGISFTPREVGEHLVSVQKNGKHITNSPFKIVVNAQEVGDASRVKVTGDGLVQGKTHVYNRFMINTKSAGYGGLSLSIEGPSKAEIDCKDNEDGTLDVDYKPTEPGFYIINIKFADSHVPGSPFQVPISGEGSEKITENIKRMREAVPVTEVGSQCRLTFKMPGINVGDLEAMVTSPSGKSTKAHVSEEEEGLYAVNFVPYELGIHTVTVRYRDVDIPGSPFQFTVGPLQDSGSHRVHAGGPGLTQGTEGEPAEFNVWTREAGPGSLAISVEGPSKAQIDFLDRKDGSCYVSYVVEEAGEYSVGIRFNEEHIPLSPYKVLISPKSGHADKVKISNLEDEQIALNAPQSFLLSKNGANGTLQCKMVSPTGREDDCFMSQVGPDEYSVRFVPKEEGYHYLHAKLNGVHVPGSPFKIKVGGDGKKDGSVRVFGQGLERVKVGEKASFVIDTSNVGAGTLSVTVDGPSKVDMDCNEVNQGYEVSYTPSVPGDYYVTVKYNGENVTGSPFKVIATGQGSSVKTRRESTSMTMETIQRTMIRQESSMFQESSMSSSRASGGRPIPIQSSASDANMVRCHGPGLERPVLGKQNSFTVDCSAAGNNVLFVGIYGPEKPCDEVLVKHQGERRYGVSYKLIDPGQYIVYVKWGDQHVYGSPFHVEV